MNGGTLFYSIEGSGSSSSSHNQSPQNAGNQMSSSSSSSGGNNQGSSNQYSQHQQQGLWINIFYRFICVFKDFKLVTITKYVIIF